MDIWYRSLKVLLGSYSSLLQRSFHIQGRENLVHGPKILIGNHANVTDGFILPFLVQEKLHYFVQEELLTIRGIGPLLKHAEQIPVANGRGRQSLDTAHKYLERGNSVVIFPEGVLNHGEQLHRAHTGAIVLAAESGVPLVPLGFYVPDRHMRMIYSKHYNRRTAGRWQFGGPSYLQIGEPKFLPGSLIQGKNQLLLRKTTERIMQYIADLVNLARAEVDKQLTAS